MTEASQILGTLPAAEGVQLILDARYKYNDVTDSGSYAPVFKVVTRVSKRVKYKAFALRKASYNATPVAGACDQSAFGQGNKVTQRGMEFSGILYDHSGRLCVDDFVELCQNWESSAFSRAVNPLGALAQNQVLQAVLMLHLETMQDDLTRIAWYSKTGFAVNTAGNAAPFYVATMPNRADITLGAQDGFWANAVANTTITPSTEATPYCDTNDGTLAGNAINPANIRAYLRKMVQKASPALRGMSKVGATAPFFLVDEALFEAYRQSLIDVGSGNTLGWELGQNSQDVLMFDGYKVYRDIDADTFDREMDAITDSTIGGQVITHSRNLRALFIAPQNAFLGVDLETPVVGADNVGLIVAVGGNPVTDAGMIYYKMMLSIGTLIADPTMMVVGYASNADTFQ